MISFGQLIPVNKNSVKVEPEPLCLRIQSLGGEHKNRIENHFNITQKAYELILMSLL